MCAHGQILDTATVPGRSRAVAVAARLLPALEPNRRYLACVVPVYAAGGSRRPRQGSGGRATSMELAWDPAGETSRCRSITWWRFGTGPNGDFESLVRRLHGVPLPAGMGRRRLRLDYPSSGMPAPDPAGADLELHVALHPPGETLDDMTTLVGASYIDVLRSRLVDAGYDISLLTSNPGPPPPAVGPPVYGQLAVGASAMAANFAAAGPPWLRETNLDPRLRVAAGLGAKSSDGTRTDTWRARGARSATVLGANNLRRRGEFSLAASSSFIGGGFRSCRRPISSLRRRPSTRTSSSAENLTVTGRLRDSPLPPSIVSVEYRRVTRARGDLPGAAAWRAAVGPAVLGSRSATAQPLKVAVALDTIDTLERPEPDLGSCGAPSILARLVPDLDQTGLTRRRPRPSWIRLSQLPAVDLLHGGSGRGAQGDRSTPQRVLTAVGMQPVVAHPARWSNRDDHGPIARVPRSPAGVLACPARRLAPAGPVAAKSVLSLTRGVADDQRYRVHR